MATAKKRTPVKRAKAAPKKAAKKSSAKQQPTTLRWSNEKTGQSLPNEQKMMGVVPYDVLRCKCALSTLGESSTGF